MIKALKQAIGQSFNTVDEAWRFMSSRDEVSQEKFIGKLVEHMLPQRFNAKE